MKLLLLVFLFTGSQCFAQDLSSPELDYYREDPINEDQYSEEELINIQESQEEVPYREEYDEELWRDENPKRELQQMEEDYVE